MQRHFFYQIAVQIYKNFENFDPKLTDFLDISLRACRKNNAESKNLVIMNICIDLRKLQAKNSNS